MFRIRLRFYRITSTALLFAVVFGSALYAFEKAEQRQNSETVSLKQAVLTCGPRCVYTWLRLTGHSAEYSEIQRRVVIGEMGSEMSDLLNAARVWERSAVVSKLTYKELCNLNAPAIVHVWVTDGPKPEGHYMVLTKATPESASLIEPSLEQRSSLTPAKFSEMWSGYAIYQQPTFFTLANLGLLLMPALLIILFNRVAKFAPRASTTPLSLGSRPAALLMGLIVLCGGCSYGSSTADPVITDITAKDATAPTAPPAEVFPLTASKRHIDLGVVRLQEKADATFSITNLSGAPAQLALGNPSCGCTQAQLSKSSSMPKETVSLKITLGQNGAYTGRVQGGVELGVAGSTQTLRFTVEGVIEGITLFPYTIRIPRDAATVAAGPIEGEVILGQTSDDPLVSLLNLTIIRRQESGLEIDAKSAQISAPEKVDGFVRRRFQLPVAVSKSLPPKRGQYPIRLTFKVSEKKIDVKGIINIVPEMEP